jgi:hypothetical protein
MPSAVAANLFLDLPTPLTDCYSNHRFMLGGLTGWLFAVTKPMLLFVFLLSFELCFFLPE